VTLFFGVGQEKPVHWPEDVRRYLPPDKAYHDRDGYSMAEVANGRGDGHARNRGDFDRFVSLVGPTSTLDGMAVSLAWVDEPEPAQP